MKVLTLKKFAAVLLFALGGAVIATLLWILLTTSGARWLLTTLPAQGGVSISAQKIEGRIIGQLRLSGVQVALAQQRVEIDSFALRWNPLSLLAGKVDLQELTLAGVRIQDDKISAAQPIDLSWPRLTGRPQRFALEIAQLRISDLSYRRLQEAPLQLASLSTSLTWQGSTLSLRELKLVSNFGQVSGTLTAAFKEPSLTAALVILPIRPVAGIDQLSVGIGGGPDRQAESFVAEMTVAGRAGKLTLLELSAEVGLAKNSLKLSRLRLTRPGQRGLLSGEGSLSLADGETLLALKVVATGLDLAPEFNIPTDLDGTLTFAGNPQRYQGHLTLTNRSPNWQGATLVADYQGSDAGLTLAPLSGTILDGTLAGGLEMSWRDGLKLQGELGAKDLNPARIDPAWQGIANFKVTGQLSRVGDGPLIGSVNATLLDSRLHGQALSGDVQADLNDNRLILNRLTLHGKGFDLHASGDLQEQLTLAAQVSDLSLLVPGGSGQLQADGWARWQDGVFSGDLAGKGERLAYSGTQIAAADLRLQIAPEGTAPLHVTAALQHVTYADYQLNAVTLTATGDFLPGENFAVDGNATLSNGRYRQAGPSGGVDLTFPSATLDWGWRGEELSGTLLLTLADYGALRSHFRLPLPARFPIAMNRQGGVQGDLIGKFQEMGLLATLIPESVEKSSGELDLDMTLGGSWGAPEISGKLRLDKGGAYLPAAGIVLRDVQLTARLEKDLIRIDSFRARSGPGHIEGSALLTMAGWQVSSYQGTLRGENFQAIHFPELRILATPDLSFNGTPQKFTLRGEVHLPELHFDSLQSRTVIAPSSDVIHEGRIVAERKTIPLELDVQFRLVLGERVLVNVSGIDAQLGGTINLSLNRLDTINSSGEIKVVKGRYRTYGVNLDIVRGRLFYSGGTIDRPALDFLALRTIGDIRAGVTVAGTLQRPLTKLYSDPVMPDVDILAYIVLGHPLGESGEQAGLVAQAASALLTSGQAGVLQEQIKSKLGLSTLDIQGGVAGSSQPMGYKQLAMTGPGATANSQSSGITETTLTVGKYLTPKLYISYGKSLFTGSNLFLLRYDLSKKWQIESQSGSESGVDLFYKMEFK